MNDRPTPGPTPALADTCGGVCAFLNLAEGASGTSTIESKTNFLRAVRDGAITASTRPLHAGRTLIVVETEVAREDRALAAKVTQTQAFHYPRPSANHARGRTTSRPPPPVA
jgi:uncharacterized protein (TIGR00369 family)